MKKCLILKYYLDAAEGKKKKKKRQPGMRCVFIAASRS